MRSAEFSAQELERILKERTTCTFEELAGALGTQSRMTVFRKLVVLSYVTSYSHRGKYYALRLSCEFDADGLWGHRGVWFSADGTLLNTSRRFVEEAPAGYSAAELNNALHVETRQTLLHLVQRQLIGREKISGTFVYFARNGFQRQRQMRCRRKAAPGSTGWASEGVVAHEVNEALILFFGLLDERQRRVFAGLEALRIGRGGDARVAALLGLDPHTIAKGRIELLGEHIDPRRIRRPGGGRRAVKGTSTIPGRSEEILKNELAEPTTSGAP